jgi:phospholipase/carboxylesterase
MLKNFIYIKKAMKSVLNLKIEKSGRNIILTPDSGYNSVFIWMHGLGDSAQGYLDVFDNENRPVPKDMKVILLTAPEAPVTLNGGYLMNSWYDIKSLGRTEEDIDQKDVEANAENVVKVVDSEAKALGGDYKKVFIGGFSQGSAMAMHIGLTHKELFGGVVCLSGYLFPFTKVNGDKSKLPVLIRHGTYDDLIPEPFALATYKTILDGKLNVDYKNYNIEHTINLEELNDIKKFIEKNLI